MRVLSCCSGQSVRLESDTGPEARVQGLDEHGYLIVHLAGGSCQSVHPDGNSFDMIKNLIVPKLRQ